MKNETVLTGIDHCTIVKFLKFLCKLCFFCQFYESIQYIVIYSFCGIIIGKSLCHRNAVILYTVCSVLTGHNLCNVYTLYF